MNTALHNIINALNFDLQESYVKGHFDVVQHSRLNKFLLNSSNITANISSKGGGQLHLFDQKLVDMTEKELSVMVLAAYNFTWTALNTLVKDSYSHNICILQERNPFYECNSLEEANIKLDVELLNMPVKFTLITNFDPK